MLKRRLLVICFAALCITAAPAFADMYGTLNVDWNGLIAGYNTLNIYSTIGGGTIYPENWVGLHSLTLGPLDTTSPPADTALPGNSYLVQGLVQAFCIDLLDNFPSGTTPYDAFALDDVPDSTSGGPMGDSDAKYIAQLLNTNTYATALDAAALQAAIWEIIYENTAASWSVSSGAGQDFYLDTAGNTYGELAIATAANTMLSGLSQASSYSQYTSLSNDTGKQAQDFVIVPVPAAVILGILGLGVVGIKLRKYA